jgi:fatty-acyl-CoA synthase
MYEWITALPAFQTAEFPTLRSSLFGGWGPSAAAIARSWAARGLAIQLAYGASELGPLVSVLARPDPEAAERGTSGTVLPHTALRLVDDDGMDVPTGSPGEIWVRGSGITPGYWGQSREGFFEGEWFRTGDAGELDEAGYLYIVGRVKEMYRSGGENVYPAEVEKVLAEAPGVAEIAILGVPDDKWGETGLAAVVAEPGATVTLEQLREFADGRLARFKLPTALMLLDELPRSTTDKISRPQIREQWVKARADS